MASADSRPSNGHLMTARSPKAFTPVPRPWSARSSFELVHGSVISWVTGWSLSTQFVGSSRTAADTHRSS
eukprot:CAMPEP_0119523630 /NCGR_PEP_ID=MMETSP1344-20130328/38657_1 /TAXON_ID=236787 /ORGANISM="Florenciella parvula, Strain CCMP2471" /LENGTH=69 /DNA_ID=CAMNT_0007561895 /DNA_START=40 /DNA_END=249 /DNA_ORIENTATION=+